MSVTFDNLSKCLFERLPEHIQNESSLSIFAEQRAKFEGWLKVATCSSLTEGGFEGVIPEKHRIDVMFDGWAIELKTLNTNYRYSNAINKHRPITKNVQGVVDDIEALRASTKLEGINKAVLFVVFPVEHDKIEWQNHLAKIRESLRGNIAYHSFKFNNGINGVIYLGQIN